jgi:hypothetical protein
MGSNFSCLLLSLPSLASLLQAGTPAHGRLVAAASPAITNGFLVPAPPKRVHRAVQRRHGVSQTNTVPRGRRRLRTHPRPSPVCNRTAPQQRPYPCGGGTFRAVHAAHMSQQKVCHVTQHFSRAPFPSSLHLSHARGLTHCRRLSLPSDNPAQLAEILARQQASAATAAPYVTVANDPDRAVPARDSPRTAASITALVDGNPPIGQPNTPRMAQPSKVPQEQSIFREDITPSSPTESWAAWSALRDWDPPPRNYH